MTACHPSLLAYSTHLHLVWLGNVRLRIQLRPDARLVVDNTRQPESIAEPWCQGERRGQVPLLTPQSVISTYTKISTKFASPACLCFSNQGIAPSLVTIR
ncbi:hypothetical protein PMIN04_006816 [Paraphaeosphaeria minitans]